MGMVESSLDRGILRCSACVMPQSGQSSIKFNEEGLCALCSEERHTRDVEKLRELSDSNAEVEQIITGIRNRGMGHPYDCLVGISGGRDSSYLLYLLTQKHGLRCLAAYYRTPFTPNVINENVHRMVRYLDVDLVELEISQEEHRRTAQELVRLWAEESTPVLANLACAPCKMLSRETFRVANQQQIPTIVYGGSKYETFQLSAAAPPSSARSNRLDSLRDQFRNMLATSWRGVSALLQSRRLWRYLPIGVQASILFVNPHTPYLKLRYRNIQAVDYFFIAEWDADAAQSALDEMGWRLPDYSNSAWRADCDFAEVKNAMFAKMTGVNYLDAYFSNMVRAGAMDREEALLRLATEGLPSPQRIANVATVLEIPEEELSAILD